ncbi:uncharacterized protein HD556DRAFT_1302876 [Suillus plorans]|uniref:Uncharacterized protein n=1 Tax=Suillus plorans TaxID=116603 RepID=A0A9P7J6Z4_9AGAM|nr:uncharacterized protein HD556DRAFT_1302876 [Suillus plorans]KAG1806388.1 hypothetical protein HD556DRAFT_1302876 [Suillus plorans]
MTVHRVLPPGHTTNVTRSNDQDPHHLSRLRVSQGTICMIADGMTRWIINVSWNPMIEYPWGDPMDTDKLSPAVMEEQHCGDVNPSVAEDPYDCGWDGREIEPIVTGSDDMVHLVLSGMPVGMQGRHAGNENKVFQHAELSMQHAITHLHSIWHEGVNSYLNNILPTDEVDRDHTPALTQTSNRDGLGKYMDAVIKVTELSEDIATVHHFLNVHRRIMEQLDNMIATCERSGRAT